MAGLHLEGDHVGPLGPTGPGGVPAALGALAGLECGVARGTLLGHAALPARRSRKVEPSSIWATSAPIAESSSRAGTSQECSRWLRR